MSDSITRVHVWVECGRWTVSFRMLAPGCSPQGAWGPFPRCGVCGRCPEDGYACVRQLRFRVRRRLETKLALSPRCQGNKSEWNEDEDSELWNGDWMLDDDEPRTVGPDRRGDPERCRRQEVSILLG